jgi:hypothetical protein
LAIDQQLVLALEEASGFGGGCNIFCGGIHMGSPIDSGAA